MKVKKIYLRLLKNNRARNAILTAMIALVAFMIFTVFSTGVNLKTNIDTMQTRLRGTTSQGYLMDASESEVKKLKSLDYLKDVGVQSYLGEIKRGNESWTVNAYSNKEWKADILPTVKSTKGKLPTKKNEIMLSKSVIHDLKLKEKGLIGQPFQLTYTDINGNIQEAKFVVSGIVDDFVKSKGRPKTSASGNIMAAYLYFYNVEKNTRKELTGNIIVSEAFTDAQSAYRGISFKAKDHNITKQALEKKFTEDKVSRKKHKLYLNGLRDENNTSFVLIGEIIASMLIIMSGYLIIYSIMYISVVRDVKLWGMFRSIGATMKQVRGIIFQQAGFLGVIGISLGLLIGTFASNSIAGEIIKIGFRTTDDLISLMPTGATLQGTVYVITIIFALLTVYLGARKPAKIAAQFSPIETLNYSGSINTRAKRTTQGKTYLMAFRNVFRDKKKGILAITSMMFGLVLFLSALTVVSGIDLNLKLESETPDDVSISGMNIDDGNIKQSPITKGDIDYIAHLKGVKSYSVLKTKPVTLDTSDHAWKSYITEYQNATGTSLKETKAKVRGFVNLLDEESLSRLKLHTKHADKAGFDEGENIYVRSTPYERYYMDNIVGNTIQFKTSDGAVSSYKIGGIFDNQGSMISEGKRVHALAINAKRDASYYTPINDYNDIELFASRRGFDRIAEAAYPHAILINLNKKGKQAVENRIKEHFRSHEQIRITLKSETARKNRQGLGFIELAGILFAGVLLLIALVNLINVLATNIITRKGELAQLECIGMTKAKLKQMIVYEGLWYGGIAILMAIIGSIFLSYFMIKLLQGQMNFLRYTIPVVGMIATAVVVLMICGGISYLAVRTVIKGPITERMSTKE